jgi:hypothetical protein
MVNSFSVGESADLILLLGVRDASAYSGFVRRNNSILFAFGALRQDLFCK